MDSSSSSSSTIDQNHEFHQNLVVMRHGDRMDQVNPLWASQRNSGRKQRNNNSEKPHIHKSVISRFLCLIKTSPIEERPWDPPLTETGKERAFITGRNFRNNDLGFPIHRVIVSPFFRCIQTAKEVVCALCAIDDDPNVRSTADNISIDPSKVKVSIEFGLCEMINSEAIRPDLAPKRGKWGFNLSELEPMFPVGTVDQSFDHLYKEIPTWEESKSDARKRFKHVIQTLADKFPSENLLFVTHGEGVGSSISGFLKDTRVKEVQYCAYSHLQRQISFSPSRSFSTGKVEVLTKSGQSGIRYCQRPEMELDV